MRCKIISYETAYIFILIHNKVAIQNIKHFVSINFLTTRYWAVIYRALTSLLRYIIQQRSYVKYLISGMGQQSGLVPNNYIY
jgi:hypothetical protein